MRKEKLMKKVLSLALAASMLLSFNVPAVAADLEDVTNGLSFEKVDNSLIESSHRLNGVKVENTEATIYEDNDVVRVSVVLKEDSVIDAGYDTEDILKNSAALKHLEKVKKNQKQVEKKLEKAAKKGLKVKHNLGITTNIISAEVKYGDIKNIVNISEVEAVIIETQYLPNEDINVAGPQMAVSSQVMTGAANSWYEGYTGAGARLAIIDTGLDIDHQSFNNDAFLYSLSKNAPATTEKSNNGKGKGNNKKNASNSTSAVDTYINSLNLLGAKEIEEALPYLNAYADMNGNLSASDLVISDKIPFGFNYVDTNLNVRHVYDNQGEHGSHVAGISAANRYLKDGDSFVDSIEAVGVSGNAPDAQVLVMKVFGEGGGAYDSDYMAAIEDAIVLGCDSVNLSLGSSSAGLATNKTYQEILDKLEGTSTVVVMSAGNSGAWADQTTYGDLYADGVNFDTAGSPGSYTNSLGVASVDNAGTYGNAFVIAGEKYGYTETFSGNDPLESLANGSEATYDYIFIDGIGKEDDFAGVDVAGKVVFVRRGEISFYVKADNSASRGAIATVIYNNQAGSISMDLSDYAYSAPCVSITEAQGAAILASSKQEGNVYTGKITFNTEKSLMLSGADYYTMSSFSSWGVPGNLSLKPEITAPGGSIWSVNGLNNAGGGNDQYELMSGTSMAAPQITGMAAVLKRYIELNSLSVKKVSGLTDRALAQSLLMSTATPLKDASGNYYSVFKQGAGLANVNDAMHASSFITMHDNATVSAKDGKVKAELGEDPERIGVYNFSFDINNFTSSNVTYNLSADVFTQETDGVFLYGDTMDVPATVTFFSNGKQVNSVTVKKNKFTTIDVRIALADETKEFFNEYLTSGAYVEAYVMATPTNGSSAHSIPVLGFYGSWTDSSMYDVGTYVEYKYGLENRAPYLYANNSIFGNAFIESFGDGGEDQYFGGNSYAVEEVYTPEFDSMNNLNGDKIKSVNYALIRNAAVMALRVTDVETGEVYLSSDSKKGQNGAYYSASAGKWMGTKSSTNINWAGTDASGKKLPEGTTVKIDLVAVPEYYCDIDGNFDVNQLGEGAFLSTTVTIDNTAPVVEELIDSEDGSLTVKAKDNVAIAAVAIYVSSGRELVSNVAIGASEIEAVVGQNLADDVYLLAVVDYAGNMSTYRVFMNVEPADKVESLALNKEEIALIKNNATQLVATITPENIIDETVNWVSSDETVAVVDGNGVVKAVGVGECVITASAAIDPEKTASCAVTVIEINKELNGVVWDEEGQVWFSQFNTANLPSYTKLVNLDAPINGLFVNETGTLYATDINTNDEISKLYTVNPETFELETVGASSIAYTSIAPAPSLGGRFLASYYNFLVLVDPTTGEYAGAFNYLSANDIVGITYVGSLFNGNYGKSMDMYYFIDNAGNIYYEAFIELGGKYYYFMGEEEALIGSTGISCDVSYFQSIYFDGEYTYISNFNESKNSVSLYAVDTEVTGAIYKLGEFDDGVWPVSALSELTVGATTSRANVFSEAVINENAVMCTPELHALNVAK